VVSRFSATNFRFYKVFVISDAYLEATEQQIDKKNNIYLPCDTVK